LAYIAMRKQQAIAFIKADYGRFAGLCLKRFIYFWAGPPPKEAQSWLLGQAKNSLFLASSALMFCGLGLAVKLRKPRAWLLVLLVAVYPAMYYLVYSLPRYRVPIEPEMAILCVFVLTEAWTKSRASRPD